MRAAIASYESDPIAVLDRVTSIAARWLCFVRSMGLDIRAGRVSCPPGLSRQDADHLIIHLCHMKTDLYLSRIEENEDDL